MAETVRWLPFPRSCVSCDGGLDVAYDPDYPDPDRLAITRMWQSRCRHCAHNLVISILPPPGYSQQPMPEE